MTAKVRIQITLDIPPGVWPTTSRGDDAEVRQIVFQVFEDLPGLPSWDYPKVACRTQGGDWSESLRAAFDFDRACIPAAVLDMAAEAYREAVAGIAPELGEPR